MSRKRTADQEPATDTANNPAADASAVATAMPVSDTNGNSESYADKVGQKRRMNIADPFGIAMDKLAGVRLFESRQDRQMAIKFGEGRPEDKPSQAVIDKVKSAGYRWNPADRVWTHPVEGHSAMSTRINAEELYQEVRQMIRQEKGLDVSGPDIPF